MEKSIGTKMNELDLCLEVVQGHVNHCGIYAYLQNYFKFGTRFRMGNAERANK